MNVGATIRETGELAALGRMIFRFYQHLEIKNVHSDEYCAGRRS
ncbi:hypothetical protein B4168_2439 [Anoxybacillus flavithermus]|nr:hypothetical protein B4168_2439 [Anoxybacillus flavithermus]OAO85341.1 hypothetical protein GT23_3032 [Parageobacillus thermoglucosidasius]